MIGAKTNKIRLPYPHNGQITVRRQAKRFNVLSAGRRWRKTTLAMSLCVEAATKGGTYIWGAPTFDQVRISFKEVQHAAGGVANFNLSRMTASFPNGGEIIFRSLDNPDNARGYTADGVVIDECGVVKQEAWHEVLRPMLIDTNGWAWLIGTPKGRNWFWTEFQKAHDHSDYAAWQVPTLGVKVVNGVLVRSPHPLENPDVPFAEIEQLHRTLSERVFEQEILAQFIELGGGVFRRVHESATAVPHDKAMAGHSYVIGVDLARSYDFNVIAVVSSTSKELVYLDRFNQVDTAVQVSRIMGVWERFGKPPLIVEQNNAYAILDILQARGAYTVPWVTTNASKAAAIQSLERAFDYQEIKILDDSVLLSELVSFDSDVLPSGLIRYGAPDGQHDDTVMALAIAWYNADNRPWAIW